MNSEQLTRPQELSLVERYRQTHDPELEAQLLRSQMGLVRMLAAGYLVGPAEREDLVQEGLMGLLKAIRMFDPAHGVRLATYAVWWIRAYQSSSVLRNHRIVRMGTTSVQRRLYFRLRNVRAQLLATGLEPTDERLAALLASRPADVRSMAARLEAHDLSLDAPLFADGAESVGDRLPAPGARIDDEVMTHERDAIVRQEYERLRATLTARQRAVFDARWGSDEAPSLQELGDRYGVSRERVRQIERAMLDRLGRRLGPRLTMSRARSA